jgi:hypothetical protein
VSERRAADWIKTRRELLDAATEGPWFQGRTGRRYESDRDVYSKREPDEENSHDITTYVWSAEDAALIANARTSLPLALDALEAVLAVLPEPGSVDMYGVAGALSLDVRDAIETALAGGCRECRQIDGHHKLD